MEVVGDLASQQWGLVTSVQAKNSGVDLSSLRRLAERGGLARIRHGVYANTATALSAELEIKAQWLALRPELMAAERAGDPALAVDAVVSHTTAAELWGIGDLWPDGIHFTVKNRRRSRQPDVRFHRADLTDMDWVLHPEAGIPVTNVARTIADLAQSGHEINHLLDLVADAARKSIVNEQDLLDELVGREDALGAERGDRRGLKNLLDDFFPEDRVVRRARLVVTEALLPVQEQMNLVMESLKLKTAWHGTLENSLHQYAKQVTWPMQSVMQAANDNSIPDITETMRKIAGIENMTNNPGGRIYPATVVSPHPLTKLSLPRPSQTKRQREDTATNNAQDSKVEEDARADHHGVENGGEGPGEERK